MDDWPPVEALRPNDPGVTFFTAKPRTAEDQQASPRMQLNDLEGSIRITRAESTDVTLASSRPDGGVPISTFNKQYINFLYRRRMVRRAERQRSLATRVLWVSDKHTFRKVENALAFIAVLYYAFTLPPRIILRLPLAWYWVVVDLICDVILVVNTALHFIEHAAGITDTRWAGGVGSGGASGEDGRAAVDADDDDADGIVSSGGRRRSHAPKPLTPTPPSPSKSPAPAPSATPPAQKSPSAGDDVKARASPGPGSVTSAPSPSASPAPPGGSATDVQSPKADQQQSHSGVLDDLSVQGVLRRVLPIRYIRRYLIFDILALLPIGYFMWAVQGRAVRLFRVPSLLYLQIPWERSRIFHPNVYRILALLLTSVLMVHWMSCWWLWVARDALALVPDGGEAGFGGESGEWLSLEVRSRLNNLMLAEWYGLVYVVGFNAGYVRVENGLMQLTLGLAFLLLGSSVFAVVIGTVQAILRELDSNAQQFRDDIDALNTFMSYSRIPAQVQTNVRVYTRHMWNSRRGLELTDALRDVPTAVRREMKTHLHRDFVAKVPLFSNTSELFIAEVSSRLQYLAALPDTVLLRKGDLGQEMYFIHRGVVNVVSEEDEKGNRIVFATLCEGSFFGEIALMRDTKRTATAISASFCELFVLNKADFQQLLAAYPDALSHIEAEVRRREEAVKQVPPPPAAKLPAEPEDRASGGSSGGQPPAPAVVVSGSNENESAGTARNSDNASGKDNTSGGGDAQDAASSS